MKLGQLFTKVKYCLIYKIGVHFPDRNVRVRSLRSLGYEIGDGTYFADDLTITLAYANRGHLRMGKRVSIGPGCILVLAAHANNSNIKQQIPEKGRWINIEDDVWLGAGVIVLPEVTIGEGAIIGAGAVVTKDIPPHSVAVGNPAKVIKKVGE
jgi:acetyltransferase-like isoleucine patch superfamily enzyme